MDSGVDRVAMTQDLIQLKSAIAKQIEWYFSDANLLKDYFLLQQMDLFGAVPLSIIASFPKMLQLTQNRDLIQQAIMEYAAIVQLNTQKMTISRVDSKKYISRNQCLKLRVLHMDAPSVESIESSLIACGLWNCLLFGCLDMAGYWNWVFPSEWHAKAAQHRILQMCRWITKQEIGICSFPNNEMFPWQYDEAGLLERQYFHSMTNLEYYPSLPIWYSNSIGEDALVPMENSYFDPFHPYQPLQASLIPGTLPVTTEPHNENRDQHHFCTRTKYSQQISSPSNNVNVEKQNKKPNNKMPQNVRELRRKQRHKGKNMQGQSGKQIMRSFHMQAEDFPPLPAETNKSKVIKEPQDVEDAIVAFGELVVSSSESRKDADKNEQSIERFGKSYAHVAASFLPSMEEKSNDVPLKQVHQSSNNNKRRQKRRERKRYPLTDTCNSKETIRRTSKHKTRNRKAKEVVEWVDSPTVEKNESSFVEKQESEEPKYLDTYNIQEDLESENLETSHPLKEKIMNGEITQCDSQEETCCSMEQQVVVSGNVSPTAVDSTCCLNWQLASSQESESFAVVENVICDDEAKSILQVLEQLHGTNDSKTESDNSGDISKQVEKISLVENKEWDYVSSASVICRNHISTVSPSGNKSTNFWNFRQNVSSPLEEGLKFLAKDILS